MQYEVDAAGRLCPVDLFPYTAAGETAAEMSRAFGEVHALWRTYTPQAHGRHA
jgi:hypothetical protein